MSSRLWAFERGVLWVMDPRDVAPAPPVPAGTAFALIGPEETGALARAIGVDESEVGRRFAAASRCLVARAGGEIVSYGWVSRGDERIGELERTLRLKPGEAYIWDCATLPAYRRRGLYTALLVALVAMLGDEGVHRVWIGSSRGNISSLRGFARAGFQPALTIAYLRLAGASHSWLSPAPGAPPALAAAGRWALTDGPGARGGQEGARGDD